MPFVLPDSRPAIMGILNVTPDSFSDGGVHFDRDVAINAGIRMAAEGAQVVDVGGESTKPGSPGVSVAEELSRVIPVVEGLVKSHVSVSIDTRKPEVARQALAAGASILNDVSGLRDPEMIAVAAEAGCTVCIMHMLGTPETMQQNPSYEDVVEEVRAYLLQQADAAIQAGVAPSNIWIDPGIGFGKNLDHNLELLRNLDRFVDTDFPVLVGVSRKSFIGRILGASDAPLPPTERLEGTLALQVLAQAMGAHIIRAHDVLPTVRAARAAEALLGS